MASAPVGAAAAASGGKGPALVTHEGQVAGHGDLLSDNSGRVYKNVVHLEARFYVALTATHPLREFVPRFYGLMRREGQRTDTLIIEDLLHEVEHPSVMDVKIGRITVLPDMPEEKRALCAAKDQMSTTTQLGLRITGFRAWRATTGAFVSRGKDWGKRLTLKGVPDAFRMFFDDGAALRLDALDAAIARLEALHDVLERHLRGYKFVSSSLLFIYGRRRGALHADVRMIDFAHTLEPGDARVRVEEVDYLYGLRNVLATLKLVRSAPDVRCPSDANDSPAAN